MAMKSETDHSAFLLPGKKWVQRAKQQKILSDWPKNVHGRGV